MSQNDLLEILRVQEDIRRRLRALELAPRGAATSRTILSDAVIPDGFGLYVPGPIDDGVVTATVTPVVVTELEDQFSGGVDVNMTGRTPDTVSNGNNWVVDAAGDRIDINGSGQATNTWVNAWANIQSNHADCILTTQTQVNTNGAKSRLLARYVDSSNYWAIELYYNQFGTDYFRIIERNAAVETVRAEIAVTISAATYYTIRAVLSGATISATLDGANSISYSGATFQQTETKHGFSSPSAICLWDSFKVEYDSTTTSYSAEGFTLEVGTGAVLEVG